MATVSYFRIKQKCMKKILVINGHPREGSLSESIAESYEKGARKAGHKIEMLSLNDLNFSLVLKGSRTDTGQLEPDILKAQEKIRKADHLVFVFPIWWGAYPALLKGFIDRVFLSGFAYKHNPEQKKLIKLLRGKTARLVVTMDTPKWFYSLFYQSFGIRAMKQGLLNYCGIAPVKTTIFSPVRSSTHESRTKWLQQVETLGLHAN